MYVLLYAKLQQKNRQEQAFKKHLVKKRHHSLTATTIGRNVGIGKTFLGGCGIEWPLLCHVRCAKLTTLLEGDESSFCGVAMTSINT